MPTLNHSLKRTVDATVEPITLAEAKAYVGIPSATTGHDAVITSFIKAAREKLEHDTRRALITQTWEAKFDSFPNAAQIELLRPPLLGVTSIAFIATTGNSVTWSSTNYSVDTNRTPGVVWQGYDLDWPTNVRDIQDAVTITFTAGFAATQTGVPERAKHAVKMLVDDWFCHRSVDGPANERAYEALVHSLRWGDYR